MKNTNNGCAVECECNGRGHAVMFAVYGVTKAGAWEFQDSVTKREDAERIGRVIADGYAEVVIRAERR